MSTPTPREALAEGLVDAAGFVFGALGGWQLGKAFGFDFLASAGWDGRALISLVFVLAGLGLGKWASLRWRARRRATRD
ncbi:MAG: hypothetical protein HY855_10530 [Burkholderiales bacterium]|nr:hypothetical protein [Burkholderiales bacterium]